MDHTDSSGTDREASLEDWTTFDIGQSYEADPSLAVVEALATVRDVDENEPLEIGFTLFDTLDPDALNDLFAHRVPIGAFIQFPIGKHTVRVYDDETLAIQ